MGSGGEPSLASHPKRDAHVLVGCSGDIEGVVGTCPRLEDVGGASRYGRIPEGWAGGCPGEWGTSYGDTSGRGSSGGLRCPGGDTQGTRVAAEVTQGKQGCEGPRDPLHLEEGGVRAQQHILEGTSRGQGGPGRGHL